MTTEPARRCTLCFQNLFAALDPGADCDGDGEFTFFDFLTLPEHLRRGAPVAGALRREEPVIRIPLENRA